MFEIKELVKNDITYIDGDCLVCEAAKLLCYTDQRVLPVVNECLEPIGLVAEKDIFGWLHAGKSSKAKVSACMRTNFATIEDTAGLADLVYMLIEENHREILVVSEEVLIGLIRRSSVIRYLLDEKAAVRV